MKHTIDYMIMNTEIEYLRQKWQYVIFDVLYNLYTKYVTSNAHTGACTIYEEPLQSNSSIK